MTEILGKKIKFFKNGSGEEYQIAGNFIHPCPFHFDNTGAFKVAYSLGGLGGGVNQVCRGRISSCEEGEGNIKALGRNIT